MKGSYNAALVVFSVIIALFASYTALALASRVNASRGRFRTAWLAGGSVAMGMGIWSMHFVGMLAYRLPVPISYDVPLWLALAAGRRRRLGAGAVGRHPPRAPARRRSPAGPC